MPKSIYYLLILLLFTIIYSEQTNAFPNSFEGDQSIRKSNKQKNNNSAKIITNSGAVSYWPHVGGSIQGGHYISDSKINLKNVSRLEIAWTHRSGDFREGDNFIDGISGDKPLQTGFQGYSNSLQQCSFYCTPYNRLFLLTLKMAQSTGPMTLRLISQSLVSLDAGE